MSPDGRYASFLREHEGKAQIFLLALNGGEARPLTGHGTAVRSHEWSGDGRSIVFLADEPREDDESWDPEAGEDAVIVNEGANHVADLSLGEVAGTHTRLTDANPWVLSELELASMEVVRWDSHDGLEIEGLLHLPSDASPGIALPLMVHIHGGPPGFFNDAFSPVHHIYAGLGYASLSPNVRGSANYTDEFQEANTFYKGDGIGYSDYHDLMTGVERLVADGIADPDRLAVRGWSYGAILGGYTLTRTDRFKAAALGAGAYDWSAEYGMGYNWDVTRWYIGGTPWENRERWMDQSTITHVDNIATPLLLLHGMADNTTTEPQSAILYQAVKDIGKAPVRWIRFPREPHGFREPRHNRIPYVEEFRWMEQHVKGNNWTPLAAG